MPKWLATNLARIGTVTFVVAVVFILATGPEKDSRLSHYIVEDIIVEDILEPVCCFIPALLLGTIGSSAILLGRRRF